MGYQYAHPLYRYAHLPSPEKYPELPPEVVRAQYFISGQSSISPYKTDLFVADLSAICLSFACDPVSKSNRSKLKILKHGMTAILVERSSNDGETLD